MVKIQCSEPCKAGGTMQSFSFGGNAPPCPLAGSCLMLAPHWIDRSLIKFNSDLTL